MSIDRYVTYLTKRCPRELLVSSVHVGIGGTMEESFCDSTYGVEQRPYTRTVLYHMAPRWAREASLDRAKAKAKKRAQ